MTIIYKFIRNSRLILDKLFEKCFKPDFTDKSFISSLSERSTLIENAKKEYLIGNLSQSQELIVEYFQTRSAPGFFLNADDVKSLIININNQHPEWRNRTIQSALDMIIKGVDVYSEKTEPLNNVGFWQNLKKGVGQDILYQVSLHRFGFAPQLILANHYGESTLEVFDHIISSWQENAESDNLAYLSDLTVISRIISLSWVWLFLAALDKKYYPEKWRLEYKLLKIIHVDAVFLSNIENQSAANNHLMVYQFSKFYIGTLFPEFSDLNDWTDGQPDAWIAELKRQTYPDGGGFEPSLHYHQLFCETAVAYILLCKKNAISPDPWVEKQLELFLNFQVSIAGQSCNPLRVGGSSDHELFPLAEKGENVLPSLREIFRFLYQPNLAKMSKHGLEIEKAFWLLSGKIAPSPEPGSKKKENYFCSFKDSGYYIFNDKGLRTRLIFRTGPDVNSAVFSGHMQSDLLSVYMIVNDLPFIVNSGTYTYRSDLKNWPLGTPAWRKYFMGPESKNIVCIEDEDPLGDTQGDFRNTTIKARSKETISYQHSGINWVEGEIIDAGNYSHFRRGVIQLMDDYWLVYDIKSPDAEVNSVRMGLQLAEKIELNQSGSLICLQQDEEYLSLAWSSSLTLSEKLKGSLSPLGGWVSEKYGKLMAATYLRFKVANDSNVSAFVLFANKNPQLDITVLSSSPCDSEKTELSVRTAEYTDYIFFRNDGRIGLITSDRFAWRANASMLLIRLDKDNIPLFLKALNVVDIKLPEIGLTITCKQSTLGLDLSLIAHSDSNDDSVLVEWGS